MKTITIPCSCGDKRCTTSIELKPDNEKEKNIILSINDGKHDFPSWISISKEEAHAILKALKSVYKGLD
jgi:hypothetical protein